MKSEIVIQIIFLALKILTIEFEVLLNPLLVEKNIRSFYSVLIGLVNVLYCVINAEEFI